MEQDACDVNSAVNRIAAYGLDNVASADAGFGAGRIGYHVPGGDALSGVHPRDPVIGKNVQGALLEVQNGENNGCQCQ